MKNYLELLNDVLDNGVVKGNRTGVETIGVFGRQLRFDLSKGFPLLTTKRLHWKSIAYELLWFMCGKTNVKWLNDRGVTIWNDWTDEKGELGPVYGHAWRKYGSRPKAIIPPKPVLQKDVQATYCGVANGSGSYDHPIGKVWQGMIQRCYSTTDIGYENYGERGVHVCNHWLQFANFAKDYTKLPGWNPEASPRLVLDKDGIGDGFCYSPMNCQWITDSQNALLQSNSIYTVEKEGQYFTFTNPTTFCDEQNIPNNNFSDLWTGRKKAQVRHGFRLVSVEPCDVGVDQLQQCVDTLKSNPNCRRILVNAWHPYWVRYSALPPCHLLFQFYSCKGKLSCQMYQRSCDLFLGVPFNIASYALLVHIIAQMTGHEPGEFIWVGGDVHIYRNHIRQVMTQLERTPHELPRLTVTKGPRTLNNWDFEDLFLHDYNPQPGIKAPIAV